MTIRRYSYFLIVLCYSVSAFGGDRAIRRAAEPVKGIYLVSLRSVSSANVSNIAASLAQEYRGSVRAIFRYASTGFSVQITEPQAQALARDPNVDFVEEVAYAFDSAVQDPAPWQLDRIDQPTGTDGKYVYNEDGSGVIIYVIGHGTYKDHSEFITNGQSRVLRGAKFASDDSVAPGDTQDYGYWPCGSGQGGPDTNSGHDTAVASLAIGNTQGVAKAAQAVPIRVWTCGPNYVMTSEDLNWAFDWIMDPVHNPYYSHRPAVVSLSSAITSCSGPDASYLENEINKVVGHPYDGGCRLPAPGEWEGIPVVVSANNFNTDAIFASPARMAFTNTSFSTCGHVISVGATNQSDQRWDCHFDGNCYSVQSNCGSTDFSGSNYGPSVDIYAPGANLTPASHVGPTAYITDPIRKSGTSYSTPVVAGVVARMMQVEGSMNCDTAWHNASKTLLAT